MNDEEFAALAKRTQNTATLLMIVHVFCLVVAVLCRDGFAAFGWASAFAMTRAHRDAMLVVVGLERQLPRNP